MEDKGMVEKSSNYKIGQPANTNWASIEKEKENHWFAYLFFILYFKGILCSQTLIIMKIKDYSEKPSRNYQFNRMAGCITP